MPGQKAVLGWTSNPGLPPADRQQIALLLTGTARAVAAAVRRAADLLPEAHAARALATSSSRKPSDACPYRWKAPLAAPRATPGSYAPCTSPGPPRRRRAPQAVTTP
ncbi:hypothetical protein [Streptomyces sp. 8N706]|uniref:hypothetical protein n=1 Tax=Streptomyces sp. 8N706 TaxID=3457416 RepID=UPI003FCF9129